MLSCAAIAAGCATHPMPKAAATAHADGAYAHGYDAGYAAGQRRGRAAAFDQLQQDPAFTVTDYQLSECRDDVSWLPREGAIADAQFWQSRQRNMWLLKQCRDRAAAKNPVIIRMLDRVRRGDE